MIKRKRAFFVGLCLVITCYSTTVEACGDVLLHAQDGAYINVRSLEFGKTLTSTLRMFSRGEVWQSEAPNQEKGLSWTSKYGYVGIDSVGMDAPFDGLNEKGLSFGFLWMPSSVYQTVPADKTSSALALELLGAWILGNFATVDEVKAAFPQVYVWGKELPQLGMMPPVHVTVHDASGKSLVIEFLDGKQHIYDNPIGVMTNYPNFPWHLDNLRNYVKLFPPTNALPIEMEGINLSQTGEGSGLVGIPGDWTPPSRFVRLAYFKLFATPGKTAADAVNLGEHLFNTVDIPLGGIRSSNNIATDYTQWVVIKDLTNVCFYYRTYENMALRSIDLKALDFNTKNASKAIVIGGPAQPVDMTHMLKP